MRLAAHPASVYGEDCSCDVIACGGAEKESCSGEVLRLAPAGGGDAFEDLAVAGFVCLEGFGVGGAEVAGGDGVDLNSFGGPLVGEGLGELGDATLAGSVGGDTDASLEAEERGDVDDLSMAARHHVASGELGELKGTGEIDLKDAVPVLESDLFGGGTVDGPALLMRMSTRPRVAMTWLKRCSAPLVSGEICLEGMGDATCGLDGGGGVVGGAAVAVTGHGGSGLRESDGDSSAEAAG